MTLRFRLVFAALATTLCTAVPCATAKPHAPRNRRLPLAAPPADREQVSLVVVGPGRAEVDPTLRLLGPNARLHARLIGMVQQVKACLGPRFQLGAGPGVGVSVGLRF